MSWNGDAAGAKLGRARDPRGAFKQVQGNLAHVALFNRLKRCARDPLVERTHRGAAPDLVIRRPPRLAFAGPLCALKKIAARHQREALVAIRLGALGFRRIDALDIACLLYTSDAADE